MTTALTIRSEQGAASREVDLLRIVRINEEIKSVVGVAFKIQHHGPQCHFLAKRAGTAAWGFGVLSNELRIFRRISMTAHVGANQHDS
ncbi:MAG: hypothetical protein IPF44_11565 [Betaproteobacteria bacterium]|nr:hypothetical protein [Betaproteobacteria bacterium]